MRIPYESLGMLHALFFTAVLDNSKPKRRAATNSFIKALVAAGKIEPGWATGLALTVRNGERFAEILPPDPTPACTGFNEGTPEPDPEPSPPTSPETP